MLQQMSALLALIIFTSSEIIVASAVSANECINFTILSEGSRSRFFSNNLTPFNDSSLRGWFAFNGSAGTHIATSCVASNHCGTLAPGWMSGEHPNANEGVVRRLACFSYAQLCCNKYAKMLVRNCSDFFVYKLDSIPDFSVGFRLCGVGIGGLTPVEVAESKNSSDNTTDECLVFNTLDERDRAADYFSYHTMKCDRNLPEAWYRFTGRAGTVMATQCVPKLHCGTISPGWLNGKHPTVEDGVVERMVCFTKDNDCCYWYSSVRVRNCSDFIVYRFGRFPASQHFCDLRYCGAGKTGCRDKDGNIYEVQQTWNPNPLYTCTCTPGYKVQCSNTQRGCWDSYGNAFVNGQEWLSSSTTKCVCRNQKIICTNLSRPACTDEKSIIREHGTNWSPGSCFNCSCANGIISCMKYHVTIDYGLFRITTVGTCMPCRRPSFDIKPAGEGTVSDCKVFFQLKKANELFHCSNGAFIRKDHVCNGITECSDGSDEAECDDVICRDEAGQVLILKEIWKVTKCVQCKCSAGLLKCERLLQVNFPSMRDAYVPLKESCEQPSCNTVDFIRDRRHACEAIETTEGGRILLEGETWDFQGCRLHFGGQKSQTDDGCPKPIGPWCHMYNGAVCCGKKCPGLVELASQMRGSLTVCTGGLQLAASDDICNLPTEICLPANDDCKTDATCQDEEANTYFEGATWSVGDCITCECKKGLITCSQRLTFITSDGEITQACSQPQCNVAAFGKSNRGICKACTWKNQTLLDGHRWTENGVDFFCSSGQRVNPGCYLYTNKINCTGAFRGIQNLSLISDEQLFLCESGDEIRWLNDRCDKTDHQCHDDSDEKDCVQYFCPSHTWLNLKWNRTAMDTVVHRSCSEVDANLGGHFSSRCTSFVFWDYKESCDCEKKTILQQLRMKLSSANATNLVDLTRKLRSEAINFTNKRLFFSYLKELFKTGVRILSPVSQQNDMEALTFTKLLLNTVEDNYIFKPSSASFCPQRVRFIERRSLQKDIMEFPCQAPNLTHTLAFCKTSILINIPPDPPDVGHSTILPAKPGIAMLWVPRTVLNLKIDSSQLSPGYEAPSSSSFVPENQTNHTKRTNLVNDSGVSSRLVNANCSWVEYNLNGSIKVKAVQVNDEEEERKALIQGYLELALSSISIVAAIISLIILSCLRIRNSERIFVHKNLLLSLCLVYIVMILDTFVFTKRKQTPKLCSSMAVIQHLTHIAIFSWMLVEGIHLYIKLVKVFSVRKLYTTYIIIGWGLPVVIVGLIGAIRPQTYDMGKTYFKDVICGTLTLTAEIVRERCWLHDGEWLYKGPILAILVVNVVIFVVLLRVIFTKISIKYQADNVEKTKRGIKSVAALLPLLGVTWLLGFVAPFSEVILYLFIILNSLQGLLFCIFHSLLDDQINEILTKSLRKWRMTLSGPNDRSSRITSTTTNLTLTDSCQGSFSGKEHGKQRQSIQETTAKSDETKL